MFATKYKDLYNSGAIFPSESEFVNIVYAVCKNSIRTTKDSSVFPDIRNTFPLLDLIARLKNITKDKKDITTHIGELDTEYKKFTTFLLDKRSGILPLDYSPTDPWARTVLVDFYKKNSNTIVSQLTLDKLQDKSILEAVMELLAVRKAGWITRIDKRVAPRIKSSSAWVSDLIFNFQKYGSGQIKVPAEFAMLYDQITPTNLVAIGSAAYEYYISESKRLNHELDEAKKMEGYKAFIQNTPLETNNGISIFDWNLYTVSNTTTSPQPSASATLQTSSFKLFDLMYDKIVINEYKIPTLDFLDEMKKGQAARKARQAAISAALNSSSATPTASATPTTTTPAVSSAPPTAVDQPRELDGGYILRNIPKDTDVYKKLLGLAEYIKTSTSFADKLSKVTGAIQSATSALKSLNAGTPSVY